ncbi:hypothetical protein AAFF_G00382940 [Aldrovandia affinis]|uniref:Uncharacterized protein n=1 Tax=Aldrovandia affinis TaxID=143900 RepID=A0AAD7T975_9TELE|nr:hypothetical protein AAFF_G00382940 [Aldrovandia affinis]
MPLEFGPFAPLVGRGHPFYSAGQPQPSSSQLANNFGPWAQAWQKAPVPNTRHNAEFLHSLQIPSHSFLHTPHFIPPPHPSFYPPPSGLPESLMDGGGSFISGQSQSPSPQSGQAGRTAQMNGTAAYLHDNPLLSPGSQNYLQLLTSLAGLQTPRAEGKRKAKRSAAKGDGRKSQPPDRQLSDAGPESG